MNETAHEFDIEIYTVIIILVLYLFKGSLIIAYGKWMLITIG